MRLKNRKILLTGGTGQLGAHLIPLLENEGATVYAPTRHEWDITSREFSYLIDDELDIVLHAAAYTDVPKAEICKADASRVNIEGTERVARLSERLGAKLVYVSTDYVYSSPMCHYAFTKLAGEVFVRGNGMIIRTSFKLRDTWGIDKLTKVFHPVKTNADWIDIVAEKIVDAISLNLEGIVNIGTEDKYLLDLAKQDYPDVKTVSVESADKLLGYHYPRDVTMTLTI